MEDTTEENVRETIVEFEDVELSDVEENLSAVQAETIPLNVDSNSRITTQEVTAGSQLTDSTNMQFRAYKPSFKPAQDPQDLTSSEEFEASDEEDQFLHKKIELDDMARSSGSRLYSTSSEDCSNTTIKEECLTDAEYLSEDDGDNKDCLSVNNSGNNTKYRRLSFGLTVADLASTVKDVFTAKQTTLSALSVTNPFSSAFQIKKRHSKTTEENPLMTCIEFLKSDPSEDELTDVEDFSTDVSDNKTFTTCDLDEAMRYRGKNTFQVPKSFNQHRSSWTTEYLSDDSSPSGDKTFSERSHLPKRNKKRNSDTANNADEVLTDEELVEIEDISEQLPN